MAGRLTEPQERLLLRFAHAEAEGRHRPDGYYAKRTLNALAIKGLLDRGRVTEAGWQAVVEAIGYDPREGGVPDRLRT